MSSYTESNFAGDVTDRKSKSGAVITCNGTAFSWACRKKSLVDLSTTEAEYVALESALRVVKTTKRLATHSGILQNEPSAIHTDKRATCDMLAKDIGTKRHKFIDLRHHCIQTETKANKLLVGYVSSADQKADMFTKTLYRTELQRQCRDIGIIHKESYGGM